MGNDGTANSRPKRADYAECGCLSMEENLSQGLPAEWQCGGCWEYSAMCAEWSLRYASDVDWRARD